MSTPISRSTSISRRTLAGLTTGAVGVVALASIAFPTSAAGGKAVRASAVLVDATGTNVGTARLVEDATGTLHVNVEVAGVSPGEHGIHLHAVGSCVTPTFASAGGHHNPLGAAHGTHAGDLPNLVANVEGRGHLHTTVDHATLTDGPVSLGDADGSALVIHAAPDDFVSQPAGNSGVRIACGVIVGG
jgi:Cu-Zn family superoxide dismutase